MARARGDEFFGAGIILGGFDGEDFFPISPVAVFDAQGDGGADGFSVAHAGKNLGAVLLDFLAAAAAVAELAAVQLLIDKLDVDRQLRGQAGDKGEERLSMRFTGSVETEHCFLRPLGSPLLLS